jgi:hypothetical protein
MFIQYELYDQCGFVHCGLVDIKQQKKTKKNKMQVSFVFYKISKSFQASFK